MRKIQILLFILAGLRVAAQLPAHTDSLAPVIEEKVYVLAQSQLLNQVPAPVSSLTPFFLQRSGSTSIVSAMNSMAGIRMEERSPGSYRINIRGSSLRSPFGVRNVKIYYNDLPLTDPGGNTYLNQLGYYDFNTIQVLRGPGNSLYGAGTAGVILIDGLNAYSPPTVEASYTAGAYGNTNMLGRWLLGDSANRQQIQVQRQQGDGYRDWSASKRTNVSWLGNFAAGNTMIKTTLLAGDLQYQTPGGLTLAEYQANPRAARPGSSAAGATIYQKSVLAGISITQPIAASLDNKTAVYGMFTEMRNPNLRNYSRNSEPHAGLRTEFRFHQPLSSGMLNIVAGGELQEGKTTITVHRNRNGVADSLQYTDFLNLHQRMAFAQAGLLTHQWELLAGLSLTSSGLDLERFANVTSTALVRFPAQLSPRVSLSRKYRKGNIYAVFSKGFSPPTATELVPTGSPANLGLLPELGTNWELGAKGSLGDFQYDVNVFYFQLSNTIVQRRDALGGEYATNAGSTRQAGLELGLRKPLWSSARRSLAAFVNYTHHDLRYHSFVQSNIDYSGKLMPGSPANTLVLGLDLFSLGDGFYGNAFYTYQGSYYLNDANTAEVSPVHLLQARVGYQQTLRRLKFDLFCGIENALDQHYSLGNDLNAIGGRYYNAAPGRGFYVGMRLGIIKHS